MPRAVRVAARSSTWCPSRAPSGRAKRVGSSALLGARPLLVTDLAPEASEAAWYGLRAWIEQSFKVAPGWQWQRTRMNDAQRATRLC